jgi:hypothetical protein
MLANGRTFGFLWYLPCIAIILRADTQMLEKLPTEFRDAHDLAFVLHDTLVEYVVQGEKERLLFFKVKMRHPEHAKAAAGLKGKALWEWSEQNGYRNALDEHSYRNLVFALLSDMCLFVYEGLKCSEKGKLSVAFSNFRKPLQDNLFYLEWILADWPDFLARFRSGPDAIDTSRLGESRKTKRVEIIAKAMEKTAWGRWLDPEWLYDLRYEKASSDGLDPYFNHAIHLVTTHKHYATRPENLNFVFCNDDDRKHLWERMYLLLPPVLLHTLHVVRALFITFAPNFRPHNAVFNLWLLVGFQLWAETYWIGEARQAARAASETVFTADLTDCPDCGAKIVLCQENLRLFWNDGVVECPGCNTSFPLLSPMHVAAD